MTVLMLCRKERHNSRNQQQHSRESTGGRTSR
ncbi:hypothetical protein TELCIR_26048 [Teladorsagia circumcincta]|uniref:Uncharacterized protein n=1 Tax=Teladorsagia circumcincta TaxID=45464 RepID=A0A2G9T3W6_TELCI|nr:hypothetical protein TELCIR_26048 [Teladorsagia circumcincta]